MEENTPKYTLVTGASAGIGKEIAIECAKRGLNLFLVSLPGTALESFCEELQNEYGVDVRFLMIDLTKNEAPREVFNFAQKEKLHINILVNNAGVGYNGKLENMRPDLIDNMILLNVRAATLLTFLFLPAMKKMDKAYIMNMSSFGGFVPLPYKSVYAATKSYQLYFTRAVNRELKGSNVVVNSVHPSGVSTKRALKNFEKLGYMAHIATLTPQKVAQVSMEKMLSGKKIVIPGPVTKFYYYLGSIIPSGILIRMVGIIFRKSA